MKVFTYLVGICICIFAIIFFVTMLVVDHTPKHHLLIPVIMFICGLLIVFFQRFEES